MSEECPGDEYGSVGLTQRDAVHARDVTRLLRQAAADSERLRDDPEDVAEIRAIDDEMDELAAW